MGKPKPYASTTVSPAKTQGQIEKMIQDHGAIKSHFFNNFETEELIFAWERKVLVDSDPMIQPIMHKVCYKDLKIAQAYRGLYWHLKAKFEAVDFGIVSFSEEFLPYFVVKLPSGKVGTLAEYFVPDLEHGYLPPMRTLGPISLKGVSADQKRILTREEQRAEGEYTILERD